MQSAFGSIGLIFVLAMVACAAASSAEPPAIAFVSDRTGNVDIYLTWLDTDSVVNLTDHPATEYGFSWSPRLPKAYRARQAAGEPLPCSRRQAGRVLLSRGTTGPYPDL